MDRMTLDSILEKIEASRKELLDLGLRNPLLNYRLLKSRGVEVVDEIPAAVFDILVRKERVMSFLPRPDDDKDYELGQPEDDGNPDILAQRHTDSRLQTNEPSDRLQSRLLNTYYVANTAIQEQGVNTLFIALGMVEWYASDTSDIMRRAPLVLIPVEIERSDARGRFYVSYTAEELGANLSFIEKVRTDFGIEIPGLPDDEDLDVDAYFSEISGRIEDMKRWSIDRKSVVLGFFSFSKFLMYRDLDPDTWPEGQGYGPRESGTIRALFGDGFSEPDPKIHEEDHLDAHLSPEDVHHVVDADSSQALAIFDVNQGRNLVIQGPPGTGKSQTITNMIAEAIGGGSAVLFVSEKMAALEVVKRRLDAIGLGVACLELHSRKTTKRAVLDELKRTLGLGAPSIEGIEDDFNRLARVQSRLNTYAEAVNSSVGDIGATPYRAYGELIRFRELEESCGPLPRVEIAGMDSWSGADFDSKLEVVSEFQTRLGRVGVPRDHVFWGSRLRLLLPNGQASLEKKIDAAIESLEGLRETVHSLSTVLGLSRPEDAVQTENLLPVAEHAAKAPDVEGVDLSAFETHSQRDTMKRLVDAGSSWVKLHSEYDDILEPSAWDDDMRETRDTLSTVGRKFHRFVHPQFRLSPDNPSISNERIDTPIGSLETLVETVRSLTNVLGLNSLGDTSQTAIILRVAEHASKAPGIEGVDLAAFDTQIRRDEMKHLADAGSSWTKLHSEYDDILEPGAWDDDVRKTRDTLSTVGRTVWRFVYPKYHRAKTHLSSLCRVDLPDSIERQIEVVEAIIQEQEHRRTFERLSPVAGAALGPEWQGAESEWESISRIVEWTTNLFDDVDSGEIAPDAATSLRDDIDAVRVRDLLDQTRAASDAHTKRVEALHSVTDMDIEGSTVGLLALPYAEQRDILTTWSRENGELRQVNGHLASLCRVDLPDGIERQIEIVEAVIQEQEHRQTFERLSPVAGAALGPKWQGVESEWESISRIVEWTTNLFDDVDSGEIAPDAATSLRDDIDAALVRDLLDQIRAASDAHRKHVEALQDFLHMDNERRFQSSNACQAGRRRKGAARRADDAVLH